MWAYLSGRKYENGFSSGSTAADVAAQNAAQIRGRYFIVTGSSSGIGVDTARQLFLHGGHVTMACRDVPKALKVAREIATVNGVAPQEAEEAGFQLLRAGEQQQQQQQQQRQSGSLLVMPFDLSDLRSVRRFADDYQRLGRPLHVLINNAGVMMCPHTLTKQGIELQLGSNHFGHFLLTELLRPLLDRQAGGRIVCVASEAHRWAPPGGIPFDDLAGTKDYSRTAAYGASKLANILHAQELNVRLRQAGSKTSAYSLHPGVIPTGLQSHLGIMGNLFNLMTIPFGKSIPQGAATSLYCATQPGIDHEGAVQGISYYADCHLQQPSELAQDSKLRKRLWQISMDLVQDYLGDAAPAAEQQEDAKADQ